MPNEPVETVIIPETSCNALQVRPEHQISTSQPTGEARTQITAAQAKVDAVAALTMSVYERAATLELTPEEAAKLQADFPDEAFQPGAGGKDHLIYIEHAHLRDRFNSVFGMGKWAIVPRNRWQEPFTTGKGTEGIRLYVEAMLIVRGCFVSESVGSMEYYPKNESQNYGDAVEGAETAAFRRCAKKFGVGLQAWKKEFCDAWWARKRGGRDFSKKKPAPPPEPAPVHVPAPKPASGPRYKMPTEKTRKWMVDRLNEAGIYNDPSCREYFQKVEGRDLLMPNESVAELPLPYVPYSEDEIKMLITRIKQFANGERAERAFEPHWDADNNTAKPAVESLPKGKPPADEWWRGVIIPIPRKGQRMADYVGQEDTIGSLFDMRHGNDEESQAARQRLWGMVEFRSDANNLKDKDGKKRAPTDVDRQFAKALQAFKVWFEENHRGEKL